MSLSRNNNIIAGGTVKHKTHRNLSQQGFGLSARRNFKLYGVLGVTKIEDEEGTSAFLYGKDRQKDRSSFLVNIYPNLYSEHDVNKRNFIQLIEEKRKEIDDNDK